MIQCFSERCVRYARMFLLMCIYMVHRSFLHNSVCFVRCLHLLVCFFFLFISIAYSNREEKWDGKKERQTQHTSAHKRILIFSAYFAFGPWCLLLWCLWRLLNLTLRKEHVRTVQRCNEQFSNYNEYPTKSEIWTKFKIHTNRFSFGTLLLFIRLYFVLRYNSQNFFLFDCSLHNIDNATV